MTFSASRLFLTATTLLALGLPVSGVPALAQYDQRYGVQSGGPPEYEDREEGGRGLFGGLFNRQERAPRDQGSATYAQMPATDLAVRLDRLENQIRQLTGSIEQLQFRNQQLEQQLKRSQEDVEFRLQELGSKGAARRPQQPTMQSAPPPVQTAPAPGRRSDAFDPQENPNAPGVPQTLGSVPARTAGSAPIMTEEPGTPGDRHTGAPLDLGTLAERASADPSIASDAPPPGGSLPPTREARVIPGVLPPPPARNPNATGAQPQLAAAPSATPRDAFALAQGYVQRKDYALAEEALREFLAKYPSDRLVSDAHYWLGESLFQRQRYRDAAESFLTVSTKFSQAGRAPDSLMRLGQSLAALGEKEAACATLGEVLRKYPKASAGVKQGVEREQKRVRC